MQVARISCFCCRRIYCLLATAAVAACFSSTSSAAVISTTNSTSSFNLLTFNCEGITAAQQSLVNQVEAYWESNIVGYNSTGRLNGVTIAFSIANLGTGILGSTGISSLTRQGSYYYTTYAEIELSSGYTTGMSDSAFYSILLHETAHALGFGVTWEANNVYMDGSYQYTGALALAAYNAEFNQSGSYIPVEAEGGTGTAGSHWNEVNGGGSDTGIVSSISSFDLRYELMTGWMDDYLYNEASNIFVSNATLQSFADNGYLLATVPEPAAFVLLAIGSFLLIGYARFRRRSL